MKEVLGAKKVTITALIFKCKCGTKFISNEYNKGLALPSGGSYPTATTKCPICEKIVEGGRVYNPIMGSEEQKKWYPEK